MKPIINVEFTALVNDREFKEESIAFHSPAELFEYVSPGGGCERIPNEVEEIQMIFLPPTTPDTENPMADVPATLKMGMVFFTGPLSDIVQMSQQLLGKASRGELSRSFLKVLRVNV